VGWQLYRDIWNAMASTPATPPTTPTPEAHRH